MSMTIQVVIRPVRTEKQNLREAEEKRKEQPKKIGDCNLDCNITTAADKASMHRLGCAQCPWPVRLPRTHL